MNSLTEFQAQALTLSISKMFQGTYFDICTFDHALKMLNRQNSLPAKDYQALRALHCVHWTDMGPEMARNTQIMVLETLGMQRMVEEAKEAPPQRTAKSLFLSLVGRS